MNSGLVTSRSQASSQLTFMIVATFAPVAAFDTVTDEVEPPVENLYVTPCVSLM